MEDLAPSGNPWITIQFRSWDGSEQTATIDSDSRALTLGLPSGVVTLSVLDTGVDLRLVPSSPDAQPAAVFVPAAVIESADPDALLKLFEAEPVRQARMALATPAAEESLKSLTEVLLDQGIVSGDSVDGYVFTNPGLKANCAWILFKAAFAMEMVVLLCILPEVITPIPCLIAIMEMANAIQEYEEHCRG